MPAQAENLVAVGRLKDAHQGFGVEAIGHDGQLGNRPLEPVDSEHASCAQHCQSVKGVIPEVAVVRQCQERVQERPDLSPRILPQQRFL